MRDLSLDKRNTLYQGILVEFELEDCEEYRDHFDEAYRMAKSIKDLGVEVEYIGQETRDNFLDYAGLGQYT